MTSVLTDDETFAYGINPVCPRNEKERLPGSRSPIRRSAPPNPAGAFGCPAPGTTDGRIVELRDVLPTFLDAAGAEIPQGMEGLSLTGRGPWREWLDLEHATCYSDDNYWCALTDGRWKYIPPFTGPEYAWDTGIELGNGPVGQLYDLKADPEERFDVAAEHPDAVERLRGELRRLGFQFKK